MIGVGVGDRVHLNQLGAERAHGILLFLALGARHHDHGPVTQRVAHDGQANTRIARGAFDDHAAGLQPAGFLGVADHAERRAILHRLAGVQEFGLPIDIGAGQLGGFPQLDQRGPADRFDDIAIGPHESPLAQPSRAGRVCAPYDLGRLSGAINLVAP